MTVPRILGKIKRVNASKGGTGSDAAGPAGNNTRHINVDFTLKDLESGRSWIQSAESRNYQRNADLGQIDMSGDTKEFGLAAADRQGKANTKDERGNTVTWNEDYTTMDINLTVPVLTSLSLPKKMILVIIQYNTIIVRNKKDVDDIYCELFLQGTVSVDESTWSWGDFTKGEIELSLEKSQGGAWKQLERE
jgi:hypothetical protein